MNFVMSPLPNPKGVSNKVLEPKKLLLKNLQKTEVISEETTEGNLTGSVRKKPTSNKSDTNFFSKKNVPSNFLSFSDLAPESTAKNTPNSNFCKPKSYRTHSEGSSRR